VAEGGMDVSSDRIGSEHASIASKSSTNTPNTRCANRVV